RQGRFHTLFSRPRFFGRAGRQEPYGGGPPHPRQHARPSAGHAVRASDDRRGEAGGGASDTRTAREHPAAEAAWGKRSERIGPAGEGGRETEGACFWDEAVSFVADLAWAIVPNSFRPQHLRRPDVAFLVQVGSPDEYTTWYTPFWRADVV